MSFVHLLLVIKNQSRPGACTITGRKATKEATRQATARRREHAQDAAPPAGAARPPTWLLPHEGGEVLYLRREEDRSARMDYSHTRTTLPSVSMYVFKGKYFWNQYHYSQVSSAPGHAEWGVHEQGNTVVTSHFQLSVQKTKCTKSHLNEVTSVMLAKSTVFNLQIVYKPLRRDHHSVDSSCSC